MADDEHKDEQFSKRPEDSAFKQQRLAAWQPLLTPLWVIGTFLVVGCIFLPIGVLIVVASDDVVQVEKRYDNCEEAGTCTCVMRNETVEINGASVLREQKYCNLTVELDEGMDPPIYVYYQLSNFYQNHRRYVKSRSDTQLRNEDGSTSDCTPLEDGFQGKPLYPCGLIANSMFNDTFELFSGTTRVSMSGKGISWKSDRDTKFKGRDPLASETVFAEDGHKLPPTILDNDKDKPNEDFIVWMRTAGLPTFKKLYRKIEDSSDYPAGAFEKGSQLRFEIKNIYPVDAFDGEKAIVLSTTSWLGGKNPFLGWAYISVAILCILLAGVFGLKHSTSRRRLGDMSYFHWSGAGAKNDAGAEEFE